MGKENSRQNESKKKKKQKSGKSGMYEKQQLEVFDQKTAFD